MNAMINKSKSPVRKDAKIDRDSLPKTSIFKGPVNQEFFKKNEKCKKLPLVTFFSGKWN